MSRRGSYLTDKSVAPRSAYVLLTLNCNSRCSHCYIEAGPDRKETMPMELREKAIDEIAKNGIRWIKFSGGEVTLLEDLADTLNYAKEAGDFDAIVVETNAYFLKGLGKKEVREKLAKLKSAGATTIYIASDDHYHNISHDELKKIGNVAKTVFGPGNVSVWGAVGISPIGRAKREVPEEDWSTGFYDLDYDGVTVSVDGKVYPCCWQATPPMGDLSEEPLSKIIERAREPDGLFRKLADNGGFFSLDPERDLGISEKELDQLVDRFGECGACYEHFRSLKNVKKLSD